MGSTKDPAYLILLVALKHFGGFTSAAKIKIGCIFHDH